ncbi:MAG: hypothetical protein R3E62_04545 [Pseudomonadales bacterium]|jgi:acetoin utilization deacetylase AcuC-like enzyme
MTTLDELVDRHVTEYNARLKHFDEMAEKAASLENPEDQQELAELRAHRSEFVKFLRELKQSPSQKLLDSGPMAIWDVVAGRLEKLVEKASR